MSLIHLNRLWMGFPSPAPSFSVLNQIFPGFEIISIFFRIKNTNKKTPLVSQDWRQDFKGPARCCWSVNSLPVGGRWYTYMCLIQVPCLFPTPVYHDHLYRGLMKMVPGLSGWWFCWNFLSHHYELIKSSVVAINFNSLRPAVQVNQFPMIVTVKGLRKPSKEISWRIMEFLLHLKRKC